MYVSYLALVNARMVLVCVPALPVLPTLAALNVKDAESARAPAGSERPPIWRKCERANPVMETTDLMHEHAGRDIPDVHVLFARADGDKRAIGREGRIPKLLVLLNGRGETVQAFAGSGHPDAHRTVLAGRGNKAAVRTEIGVHDRVCVALEPLRDLLGRDVDDADDALVLPVPPA